jgi:subtilisin family serine protease
MSRAINYVRVVLIVLFLAIFGSFSGAISAINSDQSSSDMYQFNNSISTFVYVDSSKNMHAVLADLELLGCDVELPFKYVPAVPVNFYIYDTIDKALTIPFVERIEELGVISPAMNISAPNVKAAPSTEYSPETAHDEGYTGKGITIAIIDSGVDNEHPVFTDAFIAGADFTQPESPLNPYDGTVDPDDVNGHGTGVASFALGRGGHQGVGPGVAPDAGLIDLKIRDNGPTLAQPMARAIEWCYDNRATDWGAGFRGVDVISISAGTGQQDSVVDQLITFVVSEGLTVVTAATNSGTSFEDNPNNAADYWADNAIIVGGTDDQRTIDRGCPCSRSCVCRSYKGA